MKNVRNGVFETNSSSVHSIAISKSKLDYSKIPKKVHFHSGEYGWEVDVVEDTASYLYTGATSEQMNQIVKILNDDGIECVVSSGSEWSGIDHSGDLMEFIEDLIRNKDKLYRFLFGDSVIYTGNDNSCEDEDMCYCGESRVCRFDPEAQDYVDIANPNHDAENYEYYVKGN